MACYNILVISHAYNRGYGTGYAITLYGIYIIRYHLMTYVSHLKPEGLTSSPLRGLTHDSTWLANREPSSGLRDPGRSPRARVPMTLQQLCFPPSGLGELVDIAGVI